MVTFTIGKYGDEVLYEVVPIHTEHLLLGRSWQYDGKVTHDGFRNRYSFVKDGRTMMLVPLKLKEVYEEQMKMIEK